MGTHEAICAKCGRQAPGDAYTYRFGWKTDESTRSTQVGVARVTRTSTTYIVGGEDTLFLCNRCVRRSDLPLNVTSFVVALLLGLILLTSPMPWMLGGFLLLLAAVGGLMTMLSPKVSISQGEDAVCKVARKQQRHGSRTVYWTPKEFGKLKPT